jgi:hypothetical protein
MNDTQKLDDIRRRMRIIETRLAVLQRVSTIVFERVAGGTLPPHWAVHDEEQKILAGADGSDPRPRPAKATASQHDTDTDTDTEEGES